MDKDLGRRGTMEKGISVIHHAEDQLFFNRIISRNSSVGCSSRISYYRTSEGIPFNWEMQPGTPKAPQKEDILPPISPPPAVLSLGFPKPCINFREAKPWMKLIMRFKLWKQGKKNRGNKKLLRAPGPSKGENNLDLSDKDSNYEMCSSDDGDFMASPPRISSSSSCSSVSFSNGFSFRSSRYQSPSRDSSLGHSRHYGCSPLNFSSILVRVSRRL